MSDADPERDLFEPLRPAHGTKLVLAAVIGPILWIVAWLVAAWLVYRSDAIELGLVLTIAAFVISLPILGLMWVGRKREERRFEEEGRRA